MLGTNISIFPCERWNKTYFLAPPSITIIYLLKLLWICLSKGYCSYDTSKNFFICWANWTSHWWWGCWDLSSSPWFPPLAHLTYALCYLFRQEPPGTPVTAPGLTSSFIQPHVHPLDRNGVVFKGTSHLPPLKIKSDLHLHSLLRLATIRHISALVSGPGQEFVTKESLLLRNLLQSASNLILHLSDTMSTTGNEYMTLNIVIVWLNTRRFSAYFHHSLNWR